MEQKRKQLERGLPYLLIGEPEDLVAEGENIKKLKFPINYPQAFTDHRERRSWAASKLYGVSGIELDSNFLKAEAALIDPGYKGTKTEQLAKLDGSYIELFNNLQKLLAKGETYVAVRVVTAMQILVDRRQNCIKESLSPLEFQQKMVSAAEITKIAEISAEMPNSNQVQYMLPFIKEQMPPDGIFADRLSLRTWAETLKARYEYGPAFHGRDNSTMSTNGFEVFEEQLLHLVGEDRSDKGLGEQVQDEALIRRRGRPRRK